ncbi:acyl-CoA dehydrogenase [Pseudorhodoferax sp. LjRoot39]|uniref:acyl-CoA dehydrogenase family protein n=1 Tax=Pseudorhodoferax sp. LjRoot39 TaxID=3342328 RepID=UPI003ECC8384
MNFELSDEQQQLSESVRKYLASHYGFEQRKAVIASPQGQSEAAWRAFAEMGLTAIALPEADGGFGGGALDLMPVMEALGEALVVEPLLDGIVAGRLLARTASAAQRAALLPGLADGTAALSLAYLEPGRRYAQAPETTAARRNGAGWVLDGAKSVVVGAATAARLIVSARTEGGTSLFIVDPRAAGVTLNPSRTVDGLRVADVALRSVQLGADALLGAEGAAQPQLDEALDFACALQCADAIGAMRYAHEATLEYTKTRKQFGTPIASFQVLQHRMVEMLITLEQARSMAILAAARVDGAVDAEQRRRAVSAAKVKIADAARLISQESVQLHGGMGMTEELKVSHSFRRLTMAGQRFGDADHHLERFAALD